MCYFEYNWTAGVWQFRIADRWTDFRGRRSWDHLADIKADLPAGTCLVKTASRTWQLVCNET